MRGEKLLFLQHRNFQICYLKLDLMIDSFDLKLAKTMLGSCILKEKKKSIIKLFIPLEIESRNENRLWSIVWSKSKKKWFHFYIICCIQACFSKKKFPFQLNEKNWQKKIKVRNWPWMVITVTRWKSWKSAFRNWQLITFLRFFL